MTTWREKLAAMRRDDLPEVPSTWRGAARPESRVTLQLWKQWKDSGEKPEHAAPLLSSVQNIVERRIGAFKGAPVKADHLRAQATNIVLTAFSRYNPELAAPATHIQNELQALARTVRTNQNAARITEERLASIGSYNTAVENLMEELGQEPTQFQIAERMNVPVKTVQLLQSEIKKDLVGSAALNDPFVENTANVRLQLKLIKYDLTPDELRVYEYLMGDGRPAETSTNVIAAKLGWTASKVSQTKNRIASKLEEYL